MNTDDFSRTDWETDVLRDLSWPKGLRPSLHEGLIASADEVVASVEWVDKLQGAKPKILAIEMESAGVCAAARYSRTGRLDVPVSVIRGISDLADPSKSDDEWRRLSVEAVGHLLARLLKSYDKWLIESGAPVVPITPLPSAQQSTPAPSVASSTRVQEIADDDAIALIQSWMDRSIADVLMRPHRVADIDATLDMPSGTTHRLIERAVSLTAKKINILVNDGIRLQLRDGK